MTTSNNVNELHDTSMSGGQRVADAVARNVGSWRFIIIQSCLLAVWITTNLLFAANEYRINGLNLRAWDPAPFILLNLFLSFQAAYTAPIIMMSQNRQADKDRIAAEHDYHVNIRTEATIGAVLEHLKAQDDVMLAILRQLEAIHGVKPDRSQREAEARLAEVVKREQKVMQQTIKEEEQEAGLGPDRRGPKA